MISDTIPGTLKNMVAIILIFLSSKVIQPPIRLVVSSCKHINVFAFHKQLLERKWLNPQAVRVDILIATVSMVGNYFGAG